MVEHRFAGDDFAFAKDQFLMDGTGLGLMVAQARLARAPALALLPAAAAARGVALSLGRPAAPRGSPYFAAYCWFNYVGMRRGLGR